MKYKECPHCGSAEGVVMYSDYISVPFVVDFNGNAVEGVNSDMYDNAAAIVTKAKMYCLDCKGYICKVDSMFKGD